MIITGLQSATQWDGLAHVGYDGSFYNGVPAAAVNNFTGAAKNAFPKIIERLVTRGVLLDIPRLKGVDRLPDSYEVTAAELQSDRRGRLAGHPPGDEVMGQRPGLTGSPPRR